jgi:hypothetical protein
MAMAAAAVGSAGGVRGWLAARGFAWLTPRRLRLLTIALMVTAVLVAGTMSGSGS